MKYLLPISVSFVLSTSFEAVPTKTFKEFDSRARYRLKVKTALVAIKDQRPRYEGKDKSEAELFNKLYCSVFTPNENLDF